MRKLASIRLIDKLEPIEGADKILCATIGGWEVVTAKTNGFSVGDLVIYLEIDSWVPNKIAPFLTKDGHEPRVYMGVVGERLKTIRLRGQRSQGLILPLSVLDGITNNTQFNEGDDLTEILGVVKWEPPEDGVNLHGKPRGNFPSYIRKTDQERAQNLKKEISHWVESGVEFEVTEKIDGSSMTIYRYKHPDEETQEIGVCSRNINLKLDQEGNPFIDLSKSTGLLDIISKFNKNIAIQGEMYGRGIQGNREKIEGRRFAIFDIFDIDKGVYLGHQDRMSMINEINAIALNEGISCDFDHVKVLHTNYKLPSGEISDLLELAEGKNSAGLSREGIVFKEMNGAFSFKAISNTYLEETGK